MVNLTQVKPNLSFVNLTQVKPNLTCQFIQILKYTEIPIFNEIDRFLTFDQLLYILQYMKIPIFFKLSLKELGLISYVHIYSLFFVKITKLHTYFRPCKYLIMLCR